MKFLNCVAYTSKLNASSCSANMQKQTVNSPKTISNPDTNLPIEKSIQFLREEGYNSAYGV